MEAVKPGRRLLQGIPVNDRERMQDVEGFRLCPGGRVAGLAVTKAKEKKRINDNPKNTWIMLLITEKEKTGKDFRHQVAAVSSMLEIYTQYPRECQKRKTNWGVRGKPQDPVKFFWEIV